MLSTGELRAEYGPACKEAARHGAQEAWDAHQTVMAAFGYKLRKGDTGSRSCRPITGGTGYSLHAYFIAAVIHLWNLGLLIAAAVAADFNWQTNPYGPRLVTDMPREMVDAICAIRTNSGAQVFRWGGYYTGHKDAMHYELVCSVHDLATGIDTRTIHGHPDHQPPEDDMYDDRLDKAILARLTTAPNGGALEFRPGTGEVNYFYVNKDGMLRQVVETADGKHETRDIQQDCRPGGNVAVLWGAHATEDRVDVFTEFQGGGWCHAVYDPLAPGPNDGWTITNGGILPKP